MADAEDGAVKAHQLCYCTRAEYEAFFAVQTDPDAIGVCLYAGDGQSILMEYLFMEAEDEVTLLEALFAL